MKYLNKLLVAVIMAMGLTSHAQNSDKSWVVAFGFNAVDTRTNAGGGYNWFDNHFSQPFKVKENWNIFPFVSYVSAYKYVGHNLSIGLQGSINKIDKFVKYDSAMDDLVVSNPGDLMYYGIDASLKYSFMPLIHSKVIDPSLRIGIGYTLLGDNGFATFNPGAGLTFWFNSSIGISLETSYKKSFNDREDASGAPNAPSHFQHTAGIAFKFGSKDSDRDGVIDKKDKCPNVPGLKKFQGCPDTDGDGVPDASDECPTQFGLASLKGCPEKVVEPDKDKDGVPDKDDKCPDVGGSKGNGGCPWPDTDKDGIPDKDDDCPNVAGVAANKGCPEKTPEALLQFNIKTKNDVFFDLGKTTLKKDYAIILSVLEIDIKEILKDYPTVKFIIGGHTDNTGSDKVNIKLSKERAEVVMNALIGKGISPNNLVAKGFGSSQPIGNNKTAKGRAENRRTEIRYLDPKEESKLLDPKEN